MCQTYCMHKLAYIIEIDLVYLSLWFTSKASNYFTCVLRVYLYIQTCRYSITWTCSSKNIQLAVNRAKFCSGFRASPDIPYLQDRPEWGHPMRPWLGNWSGLELKPLWYQPDRTWSGEYWKWKVTEIQVSSTCTRRKYDKKIVFFNVSINNFPLVQLKHAQRKKKEYYFHKFSFAELERRCILLNFQFA